MPDRRLMYSYHQDGDQESQKSVHLASTASCRPFSVAMRASVIRMMANVGVRQVSVGRTA